MSTILDALRQLEAGGGPPAPPVAWPERPGTALRTAAGLLIATLIGGAAAYVVVRGGLDPTYHLAMSAAPSSAPTPPTCPTTPGLPPAPASAPPMAPPTVGPPREGLTTMVRTSRSSIADARRSLPHEAVQSGTSPADTRDSDPTHGRPPLTPGEPRVALISFRYSARPEERVVALAINGREFTLHEGEQAHQIEVARIFPDRVYVRYGGDIFAVHGKD